MPLNVDVPGSVLVTVLLVVGREYGLLPIRGILLEPCLRIEVEDDSRGLGGMDLDRSSTFSSGMTSAMSGNGSLVIDGAPARGLKNVDARFGPCCVASSGSTELLLTFAREGGAFRKLGSAD